MNSAAPIWHVMVDLETLGTKSGCTILSIGAVAFDPRTGELGQTFYANIDRASCAAAGLIEDPDTLAWWMKPERATARSALTAGRLPLAGALKAFTSFFTGAKSQRLWGHGANFDEPILSAAYKALKLRTPWKYTEARDTRTVFDITGVDVDRAKGVHHNALDDAVNQAVAVAKAYAKIGQEVWAR